MTSSAIEAGARAIAHLIPCEDGGRWRPGHGENFPAEYDETERKLIRTIAESCIEAALASGSLVPAEQLAAGNLDLLEGGLKLLLMAARAGDPHAEIAFRVEEELRQLARIRALEPASGDWVLVPRSIFLNAKCPCDARYTIGECQQCGCSLGLYSSPSGRAGT